MIYLDRQGHLVADSAEELHDFARRIGMKREWYQDHARHSHYDITVRWRINRALKCGAKMVSTRELVTKSIQMGGTNADKID